MQAKVAPVYNITVNASLQRHPLQQAAPDAHHLSSAGQDLMLDMSPASITHQEAAKQVHACQLSPHTPQEGTTPCRMHSTLDGNQSAALLQPAQPCDEHS